MLKELERIGENEIRIGDPELQAAVSDLLVPVQGRVIRIRPRLSENGQAEQQKNIQKRDYFQRPGHLFVLFLAIIAN